MVPQPTVLRDVCRNHALQGQWLLTVVDKHSRSVDYNLKPPRFVHGSGGLSTWSILFTVCCFESVDLLLVGLKVCFDGDTLLA